MTYVQEAGGVAVGNRVKFLGFRKASPISGIFGFKVGDIGTVTKAFDDSGALSYDVNFPTQNRGEFPDDVILYPGEFEVIADESERHRG